MAIKKRWCRAWILKYIKTTLIGILDDFSSMDHPCPPIANALQNLRAKLPQEAVGGSIIMQLIRTSRHSVPAPFLPLLPPSPSHPKPPSLPSHLPFAPLPPPPPPPSLPFPPSLSKYLHIKVTIYSLSFPYPPTLFSVQCACILFALPSYSHT